MVSAKIGKTGLHMRGWGDVEEDARRRRRVLGGHGSLGFRGPRISSLLTSGLLPVNWWLGWLIYLEAGGSKSE